MTFEKEELEKTARLCRIFLKEEEKERFQKELAPFLALAQSLEAVELAQGEDALDQTGGKMRRDRVKKSVDRAQILSSAPQKSEGFFLFLPEKEGKEG